MARRVERRDRAAAVGTRLWPILTPKTGSKAGRRQCFSTNPDITMLVNNAGVGAPQPLLNLRCRRDGGYDRSST